MTQVPSPKHRIAVNGAAGRMGRRVIALIEDEPDLVLAAALEREGHPELGKDAGIAAGIGEKGIPIRTDLTGPIDLLIDFSLPGGIRPRISECVSHKAGILVGTTALEDEDAKALRRAAARVPVLVSPNMSLGVNILFRLVRALAGAMGGTCDVEIIETHHRFKTDAPSGTALKLARQVCEALGFDFETSVIYGREGLIGERPAGQVAIHTVRGGDVVGEHTVVFSTLGERLEVTHKAHSRDTFVRGALRAARFLLGAAPGWYTIEEALGVPSFSRSRSRLSEVPDESSQHRDNA